MKRLILSLLMSVMSILPICAQYFGVPEIYRFQFHSKVDSQGQSVSANETGLMIVINTFTDFYGNTSITLTGGESNKIGGVTMPDMPLCPINQNLAYVGTNNGWLVFNWMNSVLVYISQDRRIARVEKRLGDKYVGYTEYRR